MPVASIIVPAYNEAVGLKRLLPVLHEGGSDSPEFDVIVVCNGCYDDSFEIASQFGNNIRALNLENGSKPRAINAGEAIAVCFPRIYLDGDSEVSREDLITIAEAFHDPDILAVGALPQFSTDGASWLVKAYYDIWRKLPFGKNSASIGGSGIYALSKKGRERFGDFPDVIADDGFINSLFLPTEKKRLDSCSVRIFTPRRWWPLVKVKSRVYRGNLQLKALGLSPSTHTSERTDRALIRLLLTPQHSLKALIYLTTQVAARFYAKVLQPITRQRWQRDETTRS